MSSFDFNSLEISRNLSDEDKCITYSSTDNFVNGLPIVAFFSLLFYFYLLWMYFVKNSPLLKRHPTTLAIYKCIFEIIFIQQYLWVPFLSTDSLYSSFENCKATSLSAFLAFTAQFSLLGSELLFLIISIDLRNAYTNPFSSFKQSFWRFTFFVLGFSIFTSALLLSFGDEIYGLSDIGLVWIQSQKKDKKVNFPKICLFYIPSIIIFSYCIWANFQFYRGGEKGFSKTVSNRLSIMKRAKFYTASYVSIVLLVFLVELIFFFKKPHTANDNHFVIVITAYLYALRGVLGTIIILSCNYSEMTIENLNPFFTSKEDKLIADVVKERLALQPHLNSALRAEILYFTTQGIINACKAFPNDTVFLNQSTNGSLSTTLSQSLSSFNQSEADDDSDRLFSFDSEQGLNEIPFERGSFLSRLSLTSTSEDLKKSKKLDPNSKRISTPIEIHLDQLEKSQHSSISRDIATAVKEEAEFLGLSSTQTIHIMDSSKNDPIKDANVFNPMSLESKINIEMSERQLDFLDDQDIEFGIRDSVDHVKRESTFSETDNSLTWKRLDTNTNIEPQNSEVAPQSSFSLGNMNYLQKRVRSSSFYNAFIETTKKAFNKSSEKFRFKDFCPRLFNIVRNIHNISNKEYASCFYKTCKEKFSEGRSGAFMFFSGDERFIVKTTTRDELLALHRIMPDYVKYLINNPDSLIVRFLGAHCLTMYGVELYFVVMLNVFPSTDLSERYDLKGSWVNRNGFKGNRRRNNNGDKKQNVECPLYQDNDLQNMISLSPLISMRLAHQIKGDVIFLRDHGFMDYSLLIGVKRETFRVIHDKSGLNQVMISSDNTKDASSDQFFSNKHGLSFQSGIQSFNIEGPGKYYIGIIDILQEYNYKKKLETFFKVYIKNHPKLGISSMPPIPYAQRFWDRCILGTFQGLEDLDKKLS